MGYVYLTFQKIEEPTAAALLAEHPTRLMGGPRPPSGGLAVLLSDRLRAPRNPNSHVN